MRSRFVLKPRRFLEKAGERIRTPDRLITNQLLYQLSYTSTYSFVYNNNIPSVDLNIYF
jgi:hypothetical protein